MKIKATCTKCNKQALGEKTIDAFLCFKCWNRANRSNLKNNKKKSDSKWLNIQINQEIMKINDINALISYTEEKKKQYNKVN